MRAAFPPFAGFGKQVQVGASQAVKLDFWDSSAMATDFEGAKANPFDSDSMKTSQLWQRNSCS